jgi:tRNA A-37 threonylcarbamoyl transferase component Bud32
MDAVGGYQLLGRVSENQPESVWKGRHPTSARQVALTQVELTNDDSITRLQAKVRILSGISHPGLVEVLELIEDQPHAWLVEEWVEGVPLADVVATDGTLSAEESVAVVGGVLAGLAHVHYRAIVHGNVTTTSILLDRTGTAKLTNFGDAAEMAVPLTLRSDVRDVGRVLDALLPNAPTNVDQVIQRALALDPAHRFSDAGEFRTALDRAATEDFGVGWRDRVELSGRARVRESLYASSNDANPFPGAEVAAPGPASPLQVAAPDVLPAPPAHPVAHRVKVRSPKRARRPVEGKDTALDFLEARELRLTGSDGNAGKLIPIAATIVVVAAIIVLVLTHHDTRNATAPGLAFNGTYSVTTTLKSAGVGVDHGLAAGTVHKDQWVVTPSCSQSGDCTASVTDSTGAAFALTYADGSWTGQRAVTSAGGCFSAYTFALVAPGTTSTDDKLSGTAAVVSGGCGQSGTEAQSLLINRK